MRTATCLTLLAVGAILTFAVTGHPRFLNVQVAGLVVMATGAVGLLLPRSGGWLHRRIVVRPDPSGRIIGRRTSRYARYQLTRGTGGAANGAATGVGQARPAAPRPAATDATPGSRSRQAQAGPAQASPAQASPAQASTPEADTQVVDEYLES